MLVTPRRHGRRTLDLLFWGNLATTLAVTFIAAFPVNRSLITQSCAHVVAHEYHHGHEHYGGHHGQY